MHRAEVSAEETKTGPAAAWLCNLISAETSTALLRELAAETVTGSTE